MARVLITGCRSGIGLDAAKRMLRRGHFIYATVHREESVLDVRSALEPHGSAIVEKLDITQAPDREKANAWDIDVLINNAAIGDSGPLAEIDVQRIRNTCETNVFATLALSQTLVRKFLCQGHGRLLFVGSMAGHIPTPFLAPYAVTKFALENIVSSLRTELKPFGIPVVMINPGSYNTGFNEKNIDRKYEWMDMNGIYNDHMGEIKRAEAMVLKMELKNTASIAQQIVKAVESPRPKRKYVAPWYQWIFLPLARRFI